ncbi:MAG TPA: late competence development ComFB family protein [bacterium]|nr:late competence development ComFB family protein [bacterium]
MNLLNYMEEAAQRTLSELLAEDSYQSLKLSENQRLDILAYALNRLPPRYVVTDKGHLYTRVDELKQQFKTDLIVELTKAIDFVKSNPRP